MGCQFIYKDSKGNPSAIYARALEKYGQERAEEIYVRHMLDNIDTRFSVSVYDQFHKTLEDRANDMEEPNDSPIYKVRSNGKKLDRVTALVDKYTVYTAVDEANSLFKLFNTKVEKDISTKEGLEKGKENLAKQLIIETFPPEITDIEKEYTDRITADPSLLEKAKTDIQTLWDAQNTWGNNIHSLLSEISRQWELAYDKRERDKNEALTIGDLSSVIAAAVGNVDIVNLSLPQIKILVEPIYETILALSKKLDTRLILTPEKKIWTEYLKEPESAMDGIGGTMDLLLQDKDKKHTFTVDFKTKALHKAKDFSKTTGKSITKIFEPPLPASPESMAEAQQLIYAAILGAPEYMTHVNGVLTFILPLKFELTGEAGSKEVSVTGINAATLAHLPKLKDGKTAITADTPLYVSTEHLLPSVVDFFSKGDLKTVYEAARKIGISGIVEKWSGTDENGVPNATFSKDHKASYIANKLMTKKTINGKMVIHTFSGKPLDVTGMSNEKIKELLDQEYDLAKTTQINLPRDIIQVFKDPTKIPRSILNKSTSRQALLKGLNPKDYTITSLQSWGPAFHGIGPDVLVASHNTTGALTLLSAVSTMNTNVHFRSDGSKDKRTTLFGAYKTDDQVESGSVSEALTYEPKAHDFLAMKLGLAALYLHKMYGKNLKIDAMRVVSMGYGDKIDVTDTTFGEEIIKLSRMKEVAGEDFPADYSEMLEEISKTAFKATNADHLRNLMIMIDNHADPLMKNFMPEVKEELKQVYGKYAGGNKLLGWELSEKLGRYLEAVTKQYKARMTDEELLNNPAVQAVSKALLELREFDLQLMSMAKDHITVSAMNSLISSGDKNLMRLQTEYTSASSRIRKDMDIFSKEHQTKYNAILKARNLDWAGDTDKAFANMYKNNGSQADTMSFKDENDSSLLDVEKDYIKFFNDTIEEILYDIMPKSYHADIKSGRFWTRGDIPIMQSQADLFKRENFTSWTSLKKSFSDKFKAMQKTTKKGAAQAFIQLDYGTRFDQQFVDDGVGHSRLRRQALGLLDPNSPDPVSPNIERNVAMILNLAKLEASEKANYKMLLQDIMALQCILVAESDRSKTDMTIAMMTRWRDMMIYNRYEEEPIAKYVDPLNRISSSLLFAYNIRQVMVEFSTGTLQTASLTMANTIQNAYAELLKKPEMAGRFNLKDIAWAQNGWNKYDPIINQLVYDCGMLQADSDDLKTPEFKGGNKVDIFKSESAFWFNRLFFNSAITVTFLAQIRNKGIEKAYVKDGERVYYDETLDPRFYVYDPELELGMSKPPSTDEEQKKYSDWKAARESLAKDGLVDQETHRMLLPLTTYERGEMKQYATRAYGSFNKDAQLDGDAMAIMRSMVRYRKWAFQKINNYWTPTIRGSEFYGHWERHLNEDGTYTTTWVGDDFQGILQTVGFMCKEIGALRAKSMVQNLNKYQLENLSKLISDLTLWLFMLLLVMPFFADIDEEMNDETGEVTKVKGDFAKSSFGDSVYRAGMNATSDLMFLSNLQGLSSNVFPVASVAGPFLTKSMASVAQLIEGKPGEAATTGYGAIKGFGPVRTLTAAAEAVSGYNN